MDVDLTVVILGYTNPFLSAHKEQGKRQLWVEH